MQPEVGLKPTVREGAQLTGWDKLASRVAKGPRRQHLTRVPASTHKSPVLLPTPPPRWRQPHEPSGGGAEV